jgi:hypothetical protein
MNDIERMEEKIKGIHTRITELKREERDQIRYDAMKEQADKVNAEIPVLEDKSVEYRKALKTAQQAYTAAVQGASDHMADALAPFLPFGRAFMESDSSRDLVIGWEIEGKRVHREALSGGQKAIFDTAMIYGLGDKERGRIVLSEAAESDSEHLSAMLRHIAESGPDAQVIVCSWHIPEDCGGDAWDTVQL